MMNKILSGEHNIPDRKIKVLTLSPNQYPEEDTEEVSAVDE